jgi:hypothetical protein
MEGFIQQNVVEERGDNYVYLSTISDFQKKGTNTGFLMDIVLIKYVSLFLN